MKEDVKIKIVAIAKDEAAYLPEWIFHHLYFGLDAIDIYVNRTTDNSDDILKKVQQEYPQVNFYDADWIDVMDSEARARLQFIIYAKTFFEEKKRQEYTHILFIDVDEFWMPRNFKTTLPEMVSALLPHTTVSFPWFNTIGEERSFAYLGQNIVGERRPVVKSIVNLKSHLKKITLHLPVFDRRKEFYGHYLSDGTLFKHKENKHEVLHPSSVHKKHEAIIIHRFLRSEKEYISLLYRQNPEQHFCFKDNRRGFDREQEGKKEISIPGKEFKKYVREREMFFTKINVENELSEARKFILENCERAINTLETVDTGKEEIITKIFKGVTHQGVVDALEKFHTRVKKKKREL